jgi:type 1 fimbriae regulatory protein FimE
MPQRKRSTSRRTRDYLRPNEVDRLMDVAQSKGRHAHRNYTMILLCFRHGLRLGELTELQWRQVDLRRKVLRVTRKSNGLSSTHPLRPVELKALRQLKKMYPRSRNVFVSSKGKPLSGRSVSRIVTELATDAGIRFHVSVRMLRHGCGHALAQAGHNVVAVKHYLGHQNIQHTLRYFDLPQNPFKDFWKD